jgi:uncharacterized membrane protein YhfC
MSASTLGALLVVSGALEIIIPLILGFYVMRRFGTSWKTWVVGAQMFIVSLIRVPLNAYASQRVLSVPVGPMTYILLIAIPSLTAGIFEETARYLGFRYLIKDDSYEKGLTYGAGHGGIESILLVGLNVLSVGVFLLRSPEVLPQNQLDALLSTPLYLPLVGLYERIMAMTVQIGFSVMVLESIRRNDFKYLLAAIGLHALLDYLVVAVVSYSILASELLLTGFALGLGYWAYNRLMDEGVIG